MSTAPGTISPAQHIPRTTASGGHAWRCLDGWRGISILLVLSAHMLPLGPHRLRLNEATGMAGMSVFFTLSGFLITQQLRQRHDVVVFFIRRAARILPLAYLYSGLILLCWGASAHAWTSHLLFFANLDFSLLDITSHFWSLCVEVQFYVAIGLLMAVTRFRGFLFLVPAWLAMVLLRWRYAPLGTIETWFRVDEILSGACLALVYEGLLGQRIRQAVARIPIAIPLVAVALTSLPALGAVGALRGLAASVLVGHTLLHEPEGRYPVLRGPVLGYIAKISYALYVIHPITHHGWMESGSTLVKYLKRPLSFALTFGLAHLSTNYFESWFIERAKRITRAPRRTDPAGAPAVAGLEGPGT